MKVGLFADSHDHLDHLRLAVQLFNDESCDLVIFAGDLVSTIAVPSLRALRCPLVGCFGDNEGNKVGLLSGLSIVASTFAEPPVFYNAEDGTKFVITHMERQSRDVDQCYDVAVFGHTHKPRVRRSETGQLLINPGETGGWSFGRPTVAVLDTAMNDVDIVDLQ